MTEDQRDFLVQARKRVSAARMLLEQGYLEDAVSRAYYAMFFVAEAFLEGEGLSFSSHSAVMSAFGRHFAKTGKVPIEFHRSLIRAEELRRRGDYGPFESVSSQDAQEQVIQAERFLDLAQRLLGPPLPPGAATE